MKPPSPKATTLRATVTTGTPTAAGGPAQVLVDGADTPITANGLADYTPSPGDRLLVQRVGQQVEIIQFISRAALPYATTADVNAATATANSAQATATTALTSADGKGSTYFQSTPPAIGGPYDTWFNTANNYQINEVVNGQWQAIGLGQGALAAGAVGQSQIQNGAVGTPQIQNAAIGTAQIQDAAITSAKISYLDAGKITVGTLSGIYISGVVITGSVLSTGSTGYYVTVGAINGGASDSVTFWDNGTAIGFVGMQSSYQLFVYTVASLQLTGQQGIGITSSGNTLINGASVSLYSITNSRNALDIYSNEVDLSSSGNMYIAADGSYGISITANYGPIELEPGSSYVVKSSNTYYNNTTTGTANLLINSSGQIRRTTSIRAAKVAIEPLSVADVKPMLDLDVVSWFDRANSEALAAYHSDPEANAERLADISIPKRIPGVVAEDIAEKIPLLGTHNHDGEIDGVAYDRIGALLIPLVKDLYDRVETLEAHA